MRVFADYQHYIFDLYGTLIDVSTDETRPALWRWAADFYAAYGADWSPEALRARYFETVAEEEALLREKSGCANPEIRLEKVFLRLLKEAPRVRRAENLPRTAAQEAVWAAAAANSFRVLSRARLSPCPGARELLCALRRRGKRVYLLSNAQRVFTAPEIEQCGLSDCFDDLALSSDFGMKKPEPAFLRALLQRHAIAPETAVMIGNDCAADMGVAAACGVAGVWLDTDGHTTEARAALRRALKARFGAAAELEEAKSIDALLQRLRGA